MGQLVYIMNSSLDGYCEGPDGDISFGDTDEEYFGLINDVERPVGTYLYGRRMYETMVYWETVSTGPEQTAPSRDYTQIWRAADKVVYSRTLQAPQSARTRIERDFEPAAISALKESSARDITVGGAGLAATAMAAGLVDECQLYLVPVLVGGGKRALPDGVRVQLDLLDEHRFRSGYVYLRYQLRG